MVHSHLTTVLQAGLAIASGLMAYRLLQTGLHRRYPVLFYFMVFSGAWALVPAVMDPKRISYFWLWATCQPIQWVLDILVVRELCRLILEKYRGLATLGRWGMYAGVMISASLSLLSLLPRIKSTMPARSRLLAYWVGAGRGVTLGLAILLILMLFALSRYPVPLSKNVILNAFMFTLVFLADSLQAILRTVFDRAMNPWAAASMNVVEVVCLLFWFYWLRPDGEDTLFSWIRFGPGYEKRMLERLDTISRIVGGRA